MYGLEILGRADEFQDTIMDIATDIEITLSDVRTVHFACVNVYMLAF